MSHPTRSDREKRRLSGKAAVFGLTAWCAASACRPESPASSAEPLHGHEVVLDGVILERYTGGRLAEKVELAHARLDRRSAVARGETAKVAVYGTEGAPATRLEGTAPEARVFLRERRVEMRGGVSFQDQAGRSFRTASLVYEAKIDRLRSEGAVNLEGANFRVIGAALRGQPKAGALEVDGPISAIVAPQDHGSPR